MSRQKSTAGYKIDRHTNQLLDKKWADVQIHHRLQHEQTYKSMGDEINIPKSFKD